MFQIDDYVFHRRCGVCLVKDIAPLSGMPDILYYVLIPLYGDDKGNIVRVPVENALSLKTPMTKDDAVRMVASWPKPDVDLYILDSKKRKQSYERALSSGLLSEIAPLMEGAKQRKARDGHLNSMDAQFVSRAEPLVYGELSISLGIPYAEVQAYILSHVEGEEVPETYA